jgi:hypothetical protein
MGLSLSCSARCGCTFPQLQERSTTERTLLDQTARLGPWSAPARWSSYPAYRSSDSLLLAAATCRKQNRSRVGTWPGPRP